MAQRMGSRVTVNGTEYQIMSITNAASCGSKFYGKSVFKLRRVSDGARFRCLGKRVAHNSRLAADTDATV